MDDFSFDSGGFDLFGGDTPDFGSAYDFGGAGSLYSGGSDLMSQFNLGGVSPQLDTSGLGGGAMGGTNGLQTGGYSQGAMGIPGAAPQGQQGFMGALTSPQSLLGLGGGLAGLIGTLAGGGVTGTQQPKPNVAQRANMGIGNQWAQMGAQGQMPLQQQQMSLFNALAGGQGLPPGYQQLIEQAFQPQMGSLYEQAANAGRARGFYDSPATAPPGGAILGPGLADLQGQMAQAKLGLMQSLPQLYNQPIATQGNFAQNYLGAAQRAPMAQQQSQPLAPMIGQTVGAGLQGLGQSIGQNQQMAQNQQFQNSLLQALRGQQQGSYQFGGYSGL